MNNKNNRYANPKQTNKNKIITPTKILHYFNIPPKLSKKILKKIFTNIKTKYPEKIKQFPTTNTKNSSNLIQFKNTKKTINTLTLTNHASIPNPSNKNPYIIKLYFSNNPINNR